IGPKPYNYMNRVQKEDMRLHKSISRIVTITERGSPQISRKLFIIINYRLCRVLVMLSVVWDAVILRAEERNWIMDKRFFISVAPPNSVMRRRNVPWPPCMTLDMVSGNIC